MRRFLLFVAIFLVACQAVSLVAPAVTPVALTETAVPTLGRPPTDLSPTATLAPEPTPDVSPTRPAGYAIRLHPDGPPYVGDLVSIEVFAPENVSLQDSVLEVRLVERFAGASPLPDLGENPLGRAQFFSGGLLGSWQTRLEWFWDTAGLAPGEYLFALSIQPAGITWVEPVELLPEDQRPAGEAGATWAVAESDCCVFHYITGTEAERDLTDLMQISAVQARLASERLGVEIGTPITLTLLPKVIGHGGFATDGITLSYLDRNYAGSSFPVVLHHELVHILDYRQGGDLRPTILVEGLAVYLTGGHFKEGEDLLPRAAALLPPGSDGSGGLDRYIPLRELTDSFYPSQHEIGYLEGGALVAYMVDRWGWESFSRFYRDIHPHSSGSQADAIEAALQVHFAISYDTLEEGFIDELRRQPVSQAEVDDLRLTVAYYDTVRRYQSELQPSAYFRTAWLPDLNAMRTRGIVTDYLRRFRSTQTEAVETLLIQAHAMLLNRRYLEAEALLVEANAALDLYTATLLWARIWVGPAQ